MALRVPLALQDMLDASQINHVLECSDGSFYTQYAKDGMKASAAPHQHRQCADSIYTLKSALDSMSYTALPGRL